MLSTLLLMTATAQAAPPVPTAQQQALYEALRVRHDPPTCAALNALSPDPVTDLAWLVDQATQPPWVGMRAAQCLLQAHPLASQSHFERWLATEGHRGIAILTTQHIDELPLDVATALTVVALSGPDRADVQPRLALSEVPQVKALATR